MSRKIPGRFWLLALPVGVALVASLMVPLALAQGPPASVVSQTTQSDGCFERRVPIPLELNMEVLGPRFKTIAMEKEIFECGGTVNASGTSTNGPSEVIDVETFVEIVEQVVRDDNGDDNGDNGDNGLRVRHVEARVEVATCAKFFGGRGDFGTQGEPEGSVQCSVENVPVQPLENDLSGCTPSYKQPDDPVEMATAKTAGVIKTVNVEKELLDCSFDQAGALGRTGDFRGELFLFTEILETTKTATIGGRRVTTIRPIDKRFLAVVCVKDREFGEVVACGSFDPEFEPRGEPTP